MVRLLRAKDHDVHFDPQERLGLFMDGAHLYGASRNLGFDVDYKNLLGFFRRQARLVRTAYYTALLENDEYSPLRPLVDWLGYNGYCVVTKPAREFTDAAGRRRVRGNIHIELAVDVMTLAPRLDHVLLFAGDGDLRRLVEAVQQQGVRVSVVSTIRTQPAMVSDELRRQADQFIDLADLAPDITRRQTDPRPRPAAVPRPAEARPRATPAEPFRDPVEVPE
nr:NYN domain-containing protein [Roseomonas sp. AR75]